MRAHYVALFVVLTLFAAGGTSVAVEQQTVAGAGPSTFIVQLFFEQFGNQAAARDYEFLVPERSAKHAGGIQCSNKNLFGRTGRPLSAAEKAANKEELFLAKVPIAFAVGSDVSVSKLSLDQLRGIFLGQISNWKEVGGGDAEIVLVGREPTEAFFTILKETYPFFANAQFVKVLNKDHQLVNFLESAQGKHAISFGARPNFTSLKILQIEQLSAGVNVGLVYDRSVAEHPVVVAAKQYAQSSDWRESVSQVGLLPTD